MKRVPLVILLLAIFVAFSPPASATLVTLTDNNSTASIDTQSQAGMYSWTVDGHQLLFQQWFWYRVGSAGPEHSIDTLGLISEAVTLGNVLDVAYGSATGLEIQVRYSLDGGTAGSRTADIGEQIRIVNHGTSAIDMHFFQYSDFDLNRTNLADNVTIDPSLRFVTQSPVTNGVALTETTLNQRPTHAEANSFANTLNALNDTSPTTLNDHLTAGPGDATWAFQWDRSIAAGGSMLISKDKIAAPVPEPAAVGLLGGVLLFLGSKLRKRLA